MSLTVRRGQYDKGVDSLSIVIPIYNSAPYIAETLLNLKRSLQFSGLVKFEVILVDDGSTDDLQSALNAVKDLRELKLVRQNNMGRLQARITGIEEASYETILLLDSRVLIKLDAIKNGLDFFEKTPSAIAILEVEYKKGLSLVAYFWEGVEKIVWRSYFKNPRLLKLDNGNFDKVPKGTTALFLGKEPFLTESKETLLRFSNKKYINDDTLIFRKLLNLVDIFILPTSKVVYTPRNNFRDFITHARHRGRVAYGGYFHKESQARKLLKYFLVIPLLLTLPIYAIGSEIVIYSTISLIVFSLMLSSSLQIRPRLALYTFFLPFLAAYALGMLESRYQKMGEKK
jgi:glycosyltransferase involved in cell wall biosynthesis